MISFLVGKPRNGKSLRAMMKIWEQLTTTQRFIITNMVLDLDVLQALLIARGFGHVCARARIRMLTDEETKNFWLIREFGTLPTPSDYNEKQGADVDYSPIFKDERYWETGDEANPLAPVSLRGTFYVIDEVHTHWRARGWSGTPRHIDFYNSQHAKLNDSVLFITQNTKLVDQNLCRLAQDFTYCRNHRLEKHGRFRGDNKFTAHTYPGPVSNDKEVTLNVETYHLDKALADCYDTSAGVGMPGGGTADKGYRAKGIPLKMIWVGLGLVLVACWVFFTYGLPHFTRRFFTAAIAPNHQKEQAPVSGGAVLPPVAVLPSSSPLPTGVMNLPPAPSETIWPTGVAMSSRRVYVQMSDGTRRFWSSANRTASDRITDITPAAVVIDGQRMYFKPAPKIATEITERMPQEATENP